jgi:signal peptidase I
LQTLDSKFLKIAHDKDEEIIKDMLFELFEKEKKGWFRIISGSMSPLIDINDRVLVRKVSQSEVKLRDIILFKSDDVLITHRVVGKFYNNGQLCFIQKGDRGGLALSVTAQNVLGKVIAVEKNGQYLRLDRGWGRMVNTLLGINNYASYQIGIRVDVIKEELRDKPGFQFWKLFYRILKKPFILLNRGMVRLLLAGAWIGTRWEDRGKEQEVRGKGNGIQS